MTNKRKPNGGACLVAAAWVAGSLVAFAIGIGVTTAVILAIVKVI